MRVKISGIHKHLFGNGVKGLLTKVDDIITYIATQKGKEEAESKIENWSRKKMSWVIGGIITLLMTIIQIILMIIKNKLGW